MAKWHPITKWYREYNSLYFNNLLPADLEVKWSQLNPDCLGLYSEGCIELNSRYRGWQRTTRFTLLHEMAHASTHNETDEHGPRWKKEMRRLAKLGAFDDLW